MADRITTYQQAFNLIRVQVDDKVKQLITTLESEGHTERSIAFSIWKSQYKLQAFRNDSRFWNILRNEINKWSWKKDDPRWQEYWDRKNAIEQAAKQRNEIAKAALVETNRETIDKLLSARKSKRKAPKGFVYFVQGQCGGAIKIGYSVNPESRLKALQTGYPDTLVMLLMIPGDESIERNIHKEFEDCRLSGEWFKPVPVLIERIKELTSAKEAWLKDKEITAK